MLPVSGMKFAFINSWGRVLSVLFAVLFLADIVAAQGMNLEVVLLERTSTDPGLVFSVLSSSTFLSLIANPKDPSTGNATNTNDEDSEWGWLVWVLIGGGFFILLIILVLTAVFYSDYAKHLMGYRQMPEQANTGSRVIEVELVHPLRHVNCMPCA